MSPLFNPPASGSATELFDDVTKSGDYTIQSTDKAKAFLCTATLALTLPSAVNKFWFSAYNASTSGYVTVGSLVVLLPGEYCRVASDGSAFYVLESQLMYPIGSIDRPSSPGASYDHFVGAAIDTAGARFSGANAWTAQNLGTSTVAVSGSALRIVPQIQSGNTIRGYEQALPGSGAHWKRRLKVCLSYNEGTSELGAGLWVRNSANSKCEYFGPTRTTSAFSVDLLTFTDVNTLSASVTSLLGAVGEMTHWMYLEAEYDGTNVSYRFSRNGNPGAYSLLTARTPATFLGAAPTHIGVGGELRNSGSIANPLQLVDWFAEA